MVEKKLEAKNDLEGLKVDTRKNSSTTALVKILGSVSINGKTTGTEFKTNVSQLA